MIDPSMLKSATTIKDILKGISKDISDEFKNYFEIGLSEYIEDKFQKISLTNSFIFSDKVNFYDIYFPLTLKGQRHAFNSDEICANLFSNTNTAAIVGVAGSGKTMLMKHIFLQHYYTLEKIPLFIELRDFNNNKFSFEDYIFKIILRNRIKPNPRIIENALKSGKFIFLFDGFDEVSLDIKERIVHELEQFIDSYPENNFLFSSRPGTNIEAFPRLLVYQVQPLNRNEINSFIQIQLKNADDKELVAKLIETISKPENRSFLGYISNPLLLSMFILTYKNYPELPRSKNKFYWNVFDTLCSRHDSISKKGGFYHEKKTKLLNEDFEKILKAFCYVTLLEEKYSFDNQYLSERLKIVRDKLGYSVSIDDLIYDFSVSISILSKDGLEYKFPHRSLQDYFTALFITDQSDLSKRRIYSEKLDKIKSIAFLNHRDLFDLLIELDKESFYESCLLPILEELLLRFPQDDLITSGAKLLKLCNYSFNVQENETSFIFQGGGRQVLPFIDIGIQYRIGLDMELQQTNKGSREGNLIEEFKNDGKILNLQTGKNRFTIGTNKTSVEDYKNLITAFSLQNQVKSFFDQMQDLYGRLSKELKEEKAKKISMWDF